MSRETAHEISYQFIQNLLRKLGEPVGKVSLETEGRGRICSPTYRPSIDHTFNFGGFGGIGGFEFKITDDHVRKSNSIHAGIKVFRYRVEIKTWSLPFSTYGAHASKQRFYIQKFGKGELDRTIERMNAIVAWASEKLEMHKADEARKDAERSTMTNVVAVFNDTFNMDVKCQGSSAYYGGTGFGLKATHRHANMEINLYGDMQDPKYAAKLARIKAILDEE